MKQKIYTQYEGIKTQDLQAMLDAMNMAEGILHKEGKQK